MHQQASNAISHSFLAAIPEYKGLVQFLVQPFLESPDSLSVDCEISPNTAKVWIRVAFEGEDKGRVFGRGGRNIQAIRTVITAVAALAGHSVYLDIYGSQAQERERVGEESAGRLMREFPDDTAVRKAPVLPRQVRGGAQVSEEQPSENSLVNPLPDRSPNLREGTSASEEDRLPTESRERRGTIPKPATKPRPSSFN